MKRVSLIFLFVCWWTPTVIAQTPVCDALSNGDRRSAETILTTEYLYECCDDTIASCLEAESVCGLAIRLADNVCRRVAEGQDEVRIRRGLSRRARSMVGGGSIAEVDVSTAPVLGSADAPVTLVIYACARCPYCSKLVPELFRAITEEPLAGDVRLVFRVFPIRGHENSTPAGLGFAAAAEMGAFWPFMIEAYTHFDGFSQEQQVVWAETVGMDRREFILLIADPVTRDALVASKKEGLVNGVEETPTLFINGRRWVGDLELDELVDVLAEETDRLRDGNPGPN